METIFVHVLTSSYITVMEKNWITNRLPTKEDSRWCKYGGNQVIILTGAPFWNERWPVEERWVDRYFVEKISRNEIQPWRIPTEEDIQNRILQTEIAIQNTQKFRLQQ